jgi:hypothetical protein
VQLEPELFLKRFEDVRPGILRQGTERCYRRTVKGQRGRGLIP